jgi:magnesium transporter
VYRIIATRGAEEIVTEAPLDRLPALLAEPDTRVWVDLSTPTSEADLAIVRDIFKFHPLAIEDCFETRTHPKIEEYEGYLYLITHGLAAGSTAEEANVVELDAFVGPNYIVTHHSTQSRSVAGVQEVVLRTGLPLRRGVVGVLHALLDWQVAGMEDTLDSIEERIAHIEDAVFDSPTNSHLAALLAVKGNILQLRRWVSKQREVVLRLGRQEFAMVKGNEALLFRDVHDHLVRVSDLLENFREMLTSIQEAYLSITANRTNEIMKFLTLFTVVMMPLTVITGVFGMNFEHMPELHSRFGYPAVLIAMGLVAGSVLLYFRHRGWLGKAPPMPKARTSEPLIPPSSSPRADSDNRP